EAALERLREAIILGELTPGTPLRLEDLARSLGMSISPIREAGRQLEARGLAEHVPHHGAKGGAPEIEELRELFSIRLALETRAGGGGCGERPSCSAGRTSSPPVRTWPSSTPPAGTVTPARRCAPTRTSTSRSTTRHAPPRCCA